MIRLEIERLERIEYSHLFLYSFYRCISPLLKLFDPRSRLHDTREEHDNIVECICISNLSAIVRHSSRRMDYVNSGF